MSNWISELESLVGGSLPPSLQHQFLQTRDPSKSVTAPWMRLLSGEEVLIETKRLANAIELRGSAPFWMGDNGEYGLMYLTDPLAGRIYFLDYDGRNDSIAFRSLESFGKAMQSVGKEGGWQDLPTDYYVDTEYCRRAVRGCRLPTAAEAAADQAAFNSLAREYAALTSGDELEHQFYALNLMALVPQDTSTEIARFLDSDDMWIQERACNILGFRRCEDWLDELGGVARSGTPNGRGAALRALGRIGTEEALKEILYSISSFPRNAHGQLADALSACGCEVRMENVDPRGVELPDYTFRTPNSNKWQALR